MGVVSKDVVTAALDLLRDAGVRPGNDGRIRSAALCLQRELDWLALEETEQDAVVMLNESLRAVGESPVASLSEADERGLAARTWKAAAKAKRKPAHPEPPANRQGPVKPL